MDPHQQPQLRPTPVALPQSHPQQSQLSPAQQQQLAQQQQQAAYQQWQLAQQQAGQASPSQYAAAAASPIGSPTAAAFPRPGDRYAPLASPGAIATYQPHLPALTPQPAASPRTDAAHLQARDATNLPPVNAYAAPLAALQAVKPVALPTSQSLQDVALELEQVYDASDPTVSTTSEYLSSYAIPNELAKANASPLPLGVLLTPAVHLHPPPPRFHANIQQCARCRAHINLYCRLQPQSHTWLCALCRHQQPFNSEIHQYVQATTAPPAAGAAPAVPSQPVPAELAYKVIESVTPSSAHAAVLPPTVFPSSATAASFAVHPLSTGSGLNFIFALDRNIAKVDMGELRRQLTVLVKELPPEAGLALVTFGHTVSIHDLRQQGVAAAHVFTGETGPTIEALEGFIQEHGVVLPRVHEATETFFDCLEAIEQASSSLDQQKLCNPRALGAAVEWTTALVQAGREYDLLTRSPDGAPAAASFAFTHVTLVTSGPPDFGPGETTLEVETNENEAASGFYSALGQRARTNCMQIEYVAQGMGHFAVPLVRKMVEPSGGTVHMHAQFDAGHFLLDLRRTILRPVGYDATVDLFFSAGLRVTRVIGGVAQLKDESSSGTQGAEDDVSHLRLQLAHCRPDSSVALYYALKEDLPQDYVYLQFVLTYRDWNHQIVKRVMTRRLRTTGNDKTFVRSIDVKVVALLLVKRLVLLATQGESDENIQLDIDGQVRDTCTHFGRERRERNAAVVWELPQELNILPLLLFHVRRGPLLGPVLQHPDDIDVARFTFLHANRADALRACMPTLLSFNTRGELEELPLETLALQSNRILLLDHHTQIMVWSGSLVAGPTYDAYRSACMERAAAHSRHRMPTPEILAFAEGSSAARWMQVRLVPSHKDTPEWQDLTFPQLRLLKPEQRKELIDKFLPTDEISFVKYYHQLFGPTFKSPAPK